MTPRTREQFQAMRVRTREKILDRSLVLFANKGFHGTSIQMIAEAAGISKGLIYSHFKSKDDLLEAIIRQGFEIMERETAGSADPDPAAYLANLIEDYYRMLLKHETFWQLYMGLMFQPGIVLRYKEVMMEYYERMVSEYARIFRALGVKNANLEARLLGAIFDGIAINYFFDRERFPLKRMKKILLRRYLPDR
ncbi:MAG: TetR/AcrR family transcriptional regulator [Chlorobi bacterium]|nr:TetR/AcrR family transcriptional regulator [Chlorobiota bacterium]